MWRTKATAPNYLWPPLPTETRRPERDDTRRHAVNWFLGVTGFAGVLILTIWWVLFRLGWANVEGLVSVLPISLTAGLLACCERLIKYTKEYRAWLYAHDAAEAEPDGKRKETPPQGTLLRGADGVLHRVEVPLSETEIAQVKKLLLRNGAYSVRVMVSAVGDRASALRYELNRLGILGKINDRAATPLTAAGKKAVSGW